MNYILIQTETGAQLYQCIRNGVVVEYRNGAGDVVQLTGGSTVIDTAPATPSWDAPDPVEPPPPVAAPRTISKLECLERFTHAELVDIYTSAQTNVELTIWLDKLKVAEYVNLDDPVTIAGAQALEDGGFIAAGRAAEILG